jgi:hypothetical protein
MEMLPPEVHLYLRNSSVATFLLLGIYREIRAGVVESKQVAVPRTL